MTSLQDHLRRVPNINNGHSFTITCKSGPLGLSLLDTSSGCCMLNKPPDANSQTDTSDGPKQYDFITAVGGIQLGDKQIFGNYKGVKGLTKLLKKFPRPVVINFFRFGFDPPSSATPAQAPASTFMIPPPPPKKNKPPARHQRGVSKPINNVSPASLLMPTSS